MHYGISFTIIFISCMEHCDLQVNVGTLKISKGLERQMSGKEMFKVETVMLIQWQTIKQSLRMVKLMNNRTCFFI